MRIVLLASLAFLLGSANADPAADREALRGGLNGRVLDLTDDDVSSPNARGLVAGGLFDPKQRPVV